MLPWIRMLCYRKKQSISTNTSEYNITLSKQIKEHKRRVWILLIGWIFTYVQYWNHKDAIIVLYVQIFAFCQSNLRFVFSGPDKHLFKLLVPIPSLSYQFITAWSYTWLFRSKFHSVWWSLLPSKDASDWQRRQITSLSNA